MTYIEPTWSMPSYRPGTGSLPDRLDLEGLLPQRYYLPDGEKGSVVVKAGEGRTIVVVILPDGGKQTLCTMIEGDTCTFAGRTWRAARVYPDGNGGVALEATTPPPAPVPSPTAAH